MTNRTVTFAVWFVNLVVLFGTRPQLSSARFTPCDLWTGDSRTISLANQSPGHLTVTWDGRADNGMLCVPGGYTVFITATDGIGNVATLQGVTTVEY